MAETGATRAEPLERPTRASSVTIPESHGAIGPRRARLTRRVVRPQTVLLVASAGVFMEFVDSTIVNIAFPSIRHTFPHAQLSELSWVFNAYSIVFAAFLVTAGRLSDLLGRKRLFEIGIAVFTVGSLLCAVAPSVNLLIGARALQALGGAIVVPASLALVLHAFPKSERAGAVGVWGATAALAAALGPPLGGVLVGLSDWRLAFLVNVPIGALAFVAGRRTLVESRAPGHRTLPDLVGAILLAVAISTLVLAIVKGQEWGWAGGRVLGSIAVAVAAIGVFVWRCGWHRSPVIDLDLLRIRTFAVSNVGTVVASVGFYAYLLCHVLFLTSVWRYSAVQAGLSLIPSALIASITARSAGKIGDRRGFRGIVFVGALVWTAALAYYALRIGTKPAFLRAWLPGQLIQGVGVGLTFPLLGAAGLAVVPESRYATAGALTSSARQLGAALGVAILIIIVGTPSPAEALGAFQHGWTFAAGCFALVAAMALALGGRATKEETAETSANSAGPVAHLAPVVRAPSGSANTYTGPDQPLVHALGALPLFAGVDAHLLEALAAKAQMVHIDAGDWLFRAGEPADGVYVLRSGRLEVVASSPEPGVLRVLGSGAVVGELSLLTDSPRSASVVARRDSELTLIAREHFLGLLGRSPEFARSLTRTLGGELQRSQALVSEEASTPPPVTIALLPLQTGLRIRAVHEGLASGLRQKNRVAELDADALGGQANGGLGALLERYERDHDHVLLVVNEPTDGDAWMASCLRQADRVVVIAGEQPLPAWARSEPLLQGCDVLFDASRVDAHMDPSIRMLNPRSSQAVRAGPDEERDLRAVARRLAARSVGIVLSGGGARALAHVGVLDELNAAGVEIDRAGGASTGALIAAMFATGMSLEEIDALCYEEFVRRRPLNDYTVPRASMVRGEALHAMLVRTFREARIEELPRTFVCVSSDLMTGELVEHRSGPVVDAIRASMSIPGLMAPVASDERRLVDGGVLNNLPVEQMARMCEGPVVAVDVSSRRQPPTMMPPPGRPGAKRRSGRSAGPALPSMRETLGRAMLLGSTDTTAAAREHAQLVIVPEDRGVGFLEFHQYDVAREAGRRAGTSALHLEGASELLHP